VAIEETTAFKTYEVDHAQADPLYAANWYWHEVAGIRDVTDDSMRFLSLDLTGMRHADGIWGDVLFGPFWIVDNTNANNSQIYDNLMCDVVQGNTVIIPDKVVDWDHNSPGGYMISTYVEGCYSGWLGTWISETYYWPGGW
jgi:hypothetical protein